MLKKYKFGFDFWGLLLFLLIMIPNFIWFAVPAPNDVLRSDSVTPIVDGIGSICQVAFVAAICVLKRKDIKTVRVSKLIIFALILVADRNNCLPNASIISLSALLSFPSFKNLYNRIIRQEKS